MVCSSSALHNLAHRYSQILHCKCTIHVRSPWRVTWKFICSSLCKSLVLCDMLIDALQFSPAKMHLEH